MTARSPAQRALFVLRTIAAGEVTVGHDYKWTYETMGAADPARLSDEEEVIAWEAYRRFAATVEPKAGFSDRTRSGVANGPERKRRRVLLGMFFLIEFRSQDARIRALFEESVGRLSLKELMGFCGRRMPHFYYEWAFGVLPLSKKTFGPEALKHFVQAPDHRRTFAMLDEEKRELLSVRAVMES